MRSFLLLLLCSTTVLASTSVYQGPLGAIQYDTGTQSKFNMEEALKITNQYRIDNGVNAPLNLDKRLCDSAMRHCERMATSLVFEHQISGEPALGNRVKNSGFSWNAVAENIYMDSMGASAQNQMKGYGESPGHRANILSLKYDRVGFAACKGRDGNTYSVQNFARELQNTGTKHLLTNYSSNGYLLEKEDPEMTKEDSPIMAGNSPVVAGKSPVVNGYSPTKKPCTIRRKRD